MTTPIVLPKLLQVPSPNFGDRNSKGIGLVVVHDTEGSYAGAISWFKRSASQVSAHLVLREDGLEATQMVHYNKRAWACANFNDESINLEMAGTAAKGYSDAQLRHAARIVAFLLQKYNLPCKLVKPTSLNQLKGWTCHSFLGALGGNHSDPGFSAARLAWFVSQVNKEYARGDFLETWGV